MKTFSLKWAPYPVVILFALLFVGGPAKDDARLYRDLWDTGHFVLFAGMSFILLHLSILDSRHPLVKLAAVLGFCISFGFLTEYLQVYAGRNFELKDVFSDVFGGLFIYFVGLLHRQRHLITNLLISFIALIIFVMGTRTFIISLVDEWRISQSFPVLSDFERYSELKRWKARSARILSSDEYQASGKRSMKVYFGGNRYPSINLRYFKKDWRDFQFLNFSIYNPGQDPLSLEIKLTDEIHPQFHFDYKDRFNRTIESAPGWNHYKINLEDVINAPEMRKMDISQMRRFGIFMRRPGRVISFYLDHVYLSE